MLLENISLQGSHILEVKEEAHSQMIDILLDSPADQDQHKFEKKTLRLKEVMLYTRKEMPFSGNPVIRCIKVLNTPEHPYQAFCSSACTSRYKIEIVTNTGSRFLEFADCELV